MDDRERKYIDVGHVDASARPGSAPDEAIQAAIILAATEWRNVRLKLGDKAYWVKPNSLVESVLDNPIGVTATGGEQGNGQ